MKGILQAKPPTPKYSKTWDPSIVLSHLDVTAGHTLSLLQLARKLVTLLALTTLLRRPKLRLSRQRRLSLLVLKFTLIWEPSKNPSVPARLCVFH